MNTNHSLRNKWLCKTLEGRTVPIFVGVGTYPNLHSQVSKRPCAGGCFWVETYVNLNSESAQGLEQVHGLGV